jgi:hypothetical protein
VEKLILLYTPLGILVLLFLIILRTYLARIMHESWRV